MKQDFKFSLPTNHRSHFTEAIEFFDLKKHETRTVNAYLPLKKKLKTTRLKLGSNSSNFGEYTLTLSDEFKKNR